ncbi:MAG: cation-translocating P-type ATPase [Candidatus Pacebacteria bacterium]|nr:cation-translocating P-type ATPase [Candidatus Paceibacterota bacterium]
MSKACCGDTEKIVEEKKINWRTIATVISGIGTVLGFLLSYAGVSENITSVLFLISIVVGGVFVVQGAFEGLTKKKFLNIEFLVVIASIGALYLGELGEASAVIFFFSLAEAFESFGVKRSRKALEELVKNNPKQATLKDGRVLDIDSVQLNAIVVMKPGDLIPLDGTIILGTSAINEASITGESLPKDKIVGDAVYAGTINVNGYLEIRVTKISKDSTISKIVELVSSAQESKTQSEEFVDSFAKYYTPAVALVALLIVAIPVLFFDGSFLIWLERAITLLVVACPCALVIATPVTVTSALGGASKKGILIKGGKFLELLGKVNVIAFDKTGTLTIGKPVVTDVIVFNGFTEQELLEDVAGMESFSTHPLAEAIIDYAKKKGITPHQMESYQNIPGKGGKAICKICDDLEHCVGNLKMMDAHNVSVDEITKDTEKFEKEGKTVVLVSEKDKVMGMLAISDIVREASANTIHTLSLNNVSSAMLTGDNVHSAKYISEELGIQNVFAGLLPEEKVEKIRELKEKYGVVAMVGDGVNDAPALALSDVGIAMGGKGTDIALETADMVLMNDRIELIPDIVKLGKRTLGTIKVNVALAVGSKLVFVGLAIFGMANLGVAIATDTGVAILVILNGLRLFKS